MQSITILGATGSIGRNTLDVIGQHPDKYSVFALTGQSQLKLLAQQSVAFNAKYAVIKDEASAKQLSQLIQDLKATQRCFLVSRHYVMSQAVRRCRW